MDLNTGKLYDLTDEEAKEMLRNPLKNLTKIEFDDMTKRQKEMMQVSKYDNKSILGKTYTEARKVCWSQLTKNQKRNMKKKLGLK